MARSTGTVAARNRHRKVLRSTKGYYGARGNTIRAAKQALMRSGQYAYRDRRRRKREFRALWIVRINAGVRMHGLSYSRFMSGLGRSGIVLDRRMLADLALNDKEAFSSMVEMAKKHLPQ